MQGVPVKADLLQQLVRFIKDGPARRFIYTAGFHAHKPVFHHIQKPHAMRAADFVERVHKRNRGKRLTVYRNGYALFKGDRDKSGIIRRLLGRHGHFKEPVLAIGRLVCRIFQVKPFMGKVPEVLILGIVGFAVDFERNVMRLGIGDLILAGFELPFPPRGNDRKFRGKRLDCKLKAHLIVSLAGAAMANRISALLLGNFNKPLCDGGPCERGAEQIFLFIDRAGLDGGVDVIGYEGFLQILNIQLGSAGFERFCLKPIQLISLAHIAGHGDDFTIIVIFLQPRNDNGSIQAAGICQHNFFNLLFHRISSSALYCT